MDQPFVTGRVSTFAGPVPVVSTGTTWADRVGTLRVRMGIDRDHYRVDPGLYAVGDPDDEAPVLVSANYKLSFDALRRSVAGRDAWILVLDTRGINVWCAAGKGTFGTDEVCRRIEGSQLAMVVSHGTVVLPQLGAPGVSAPEVRSRTGFRALFGPVRASDLPAYLDAGMKATPEMRRVTFTMRDRLVLGPVEFFGAVLQALWVVPVLFVISGFGPWLFSLDAALQRGLSATAVFLVGGLAGAFVTPVLLPWLPGRAFSLKGAIAGSALAALTLALWGRPLDYVAAAAVLLAMPAWASWIAMNFTGASTFTSPTGVVKEMRAAMPLQAIGLVLGVALWIGSAWFSRGGA
jgi:hypothetical protein